MFIVPLPMTRQARVQGEGPKRPAPPPTNSRAKKIKNTKKYKKKVVRANDLYFATFLVENVIFSASF